MSLCSPNGGHCRETSLRRQPEVPTARDPQGLQGARSGQGPAAGGPAGRPTVSYERDSHVATAPETSRGMTTAPETSRGVLECDADAAELRACGLVTHDLPVETGHICAGPCVVTTAPGNSVISVYAGNDNVPTLTCAQPSLQLPLPATQNCSEPNRPAQSAENQPCQTQSTPSVMHTDWGDPRARR